MTTEVLPPEQGATRRISPSDFQRVGAPNFDKKRTRKEIRRDRPKPYKKRDYPGRKSPAKQWPDGLPPKPDGTPRRGPVPVPAKPLPPLAQSRMAQLARRSGRLLPPLRTLSALVDIVDLVDPSKIVNPKKPPKPNPANGWYKIFGDCPTASPNHSSTHGVPGIDWTCLAGQALGVPNGILAPSGTRWMLSEGKFISSIGDWRHVVHSGWARPSNTAQKQPLTIPATEVVPAISVGLDPNVIRDLPSVPPGDPLAAEPQPDRLAVPVEEILRRLDALSDRSFEVSTDILPGIGAAPGIGRSPSPGYAPSPSDKVEPQPGLDPAKPRDPEAPPTIRKPDEPVMRPKPPHIRQRPPRREKQGKLRGPLFYAFAIADSVSEGAEVVDALFDALPADVKRRWRRDRKESGADDYRHPLIDQAGQYGIDGADWKAQAVFYNFHKIDLVQAIKNIVANQVEDKLIGSLHRNLPRNMINAAEDGQKAYAKLVSMLLEEVGLN